MSIVDHIKPARRGVSVGFQHFGHNLHCSVQHSTPLNSATNSEKAALRLWVQEATPPFVRCSYPLSQPPHCSPGAPAVQHDTVWLVVSLRLAQSAPSQVSVSSEHPPSSPRSLGPVPTDKSDPGGKSQSHHRHCQRQRLEIWVCACNSRNFVSASVLGLRTAACPGSTPPKPPSFVGPGAVRSRCNLGGRASDLSGTRSRTKNALYTKSEVLWRDFDASTCRLSRSHSQGSACCSSACVTALHVASSSRMQLRFCLLDMSTAWLLWPQCKVSRRPNCAFKIHNVPLPIARRLGPRPSKGQARLQRHIILERANKDWSAEIETLQRSHAKEEHWFHFTPRSRELAAVRYQLIHCSAPEAGFCCFHCRRSG